MARREQLVDAGVSKLNGSITSYATSLTLKTGDGVLFPATGDFRLMIAQEILLCTARNGDVLTVVRGMEGTTAAAYGSNTPLASILTNGAVQTYLADNLPWAGTQLPFRIVNTAGNALHIGNALSAGDFGVVDPDHNAVMTQSGNGISVYKPTGTGAATGMLLTRPLPLGGVIQLVACVDAGSNNNSTAYKGIGFRCSATGHVSLLQWCPTTAQVLVRTGQTGPDSQPSCIWGPAGVAAYDRLWIKAVLIPANGPAWSFFVSENGVDWIMVWGGNPQVDSTFNGGTPDQLVFFCMGYNSLASSHNLLAWYEGYAADLPEAGLMAWWKLNESDPASGFADSSGLGNHLQHTASNLWPASSSDVPANHTNAAWRSALYPFDGSGAVAYRDTTEGNGDAGWSLPFGSSPRTISFWFKLPSSVAWSGVANCAFSYGHQSAYGGYNFTINVNPSGLSIDMDWSGASYATSISQDAWHHAILLVPPGITDNNQIQFYVDGVLATTGLSSSNAVVNTQMNQVATGHIGGGLGIGDFTQYHYRGLLCDLRIYNRALTFTEITNLYNGLHADGTTPVI